jgi:hypothetical protein
VSAAEVALDDDAIETMVGECDEAAKELRE